MNISTFRRRTLIYAITMDENIEDDHYSVGTTYINLNSFQKYDRTRGRVMSNFIKILRGENLLEMLGAKHHALPLDKISTARPGCRKPFAIQRKPTVEIRVTRAAQRISVISGYYLYDKCTARYREGRQKQDAKLMAIKQLLEKEVMQ